MIVIDFETKPIEPRPAYPPAPVGVAVIPPGSQRGTYLAWGHPSQNNATLGDGRRVVKRAWDSGDVLLFHNAAFDIEVAMEAFGVGFPDPERWRDTLFEAFLVDPNSEALHLKELAERYLRRAPRERDELHEWLVANVTEAKRAKKQAGRYIYLAPGDLVGRYAVCDVERTLGLHRFFAKFLVGMEDAYRRERELTPVLIEMERSGVPVAQKRLSRDLKLWEARLAALDKWLAKRIGLADGASLDEREKVADALARAKLVEHFVQTEKGSRSTSRENLMRVISDPLVASAYAYRGKLATSVRTFARPWLEVARRADGRIFTRWNQVRSQDEARGRAFGARTGRLSSNPNFQNIPVRLPVITSDPAALREAVARGVDCFWLPPGAECWSLPNLRDYIAAPAGSIIIDGDFSQQELKILAHYERGEMKRAYLADPDLDLHEHARQLINTELEASWDRKPIKNTGFAVIYGTGVGHFAEMLRIDVATARTLRDAYKTRVFPGLAALDRALRLRVKDGGFITTRGGRRYRVEPPRLIKAGPRRGDVQHFEYKLINTIVQGSAADMIKATMVEYARLGGPGRMILTVHDELVILAPKRAIREEERRLHASAKALEFDVPISMKTSRGPTWARAKEG